jgi:glycosyltransferase involved in cell wall biosynthesis
MFEQPSFSVVIPLYNKADTLIRALNCVISQTVLPLEVLVVDNGSSDGGRALAENFHPLVRVLDASVRGVSVARNTGIAAAEGNFIAFLDADDVWEPDFLETIQGLIIDFPGAGWYALGYAFKWEAKLAYPNHPLPSAFKRGYVPNYFELVAKGDMLATASSVVIGKQILNELGCFAEGEAIGEDQDLWARIALRYRVAFDQQLKAYYIQDANNMATRRKTEKRLWPFVERLAAEAHGLPAEVKNDLLQYLSRQLVGQASLLVLDKEFKAAENILRHHLAPKQGLRYWYWKGRALLCL